MRKDSALQLLPTYRLQYKDANRIFAIMSCFVILINLYLLFQSSSRVMTILMSFALFICFSAIFVYWKYLPTILKLNNDAYFYAATTIEFICILIGIAPLCIFLFVEQQWELFNRYGINCLFLFNIFENWLLPVSVFLMVSTTYWLIIYNIKKESNLFYQLEKKKKELYE